MHACVVPARAPARACVSRVAASLADGTLHAQEWARAENAYADRHGPQEELLTTEDLAGLNQLDDDNPSKKNLSRLSTESITGLPFMQNRVRPGL